MPEIIEAPFRLYQGDPGIARANGTASTWCDIWKYQVPLGVSLVIKPNHTFAVYLISNESTPLEASSSKTSVKIEKRDASGSDVIILFGPKLYLTVKEFQEGSKMAKMSVPDEGTIINEREYLVIAVYSDYSINATNGYFELHISKVRKAIGA